MYKIMPANGAGPNVLEPSDVVVMAYIDPSLNFKLANGTTATTTVLAANGSTLTMPAGTTPALNDTSVGLTVGDLLLLQNSNGSAVGVVTTFSAATGVITFAVNDPLNINQSSAPVGNIKSLATPGTPPTYPAVTVSRIFMITYFLQQLVTPDGPDVRLMRQVGAQTPTPVAEHIEDLQLTYDVFDDDTSTLTANLPDAATGTPRYPNPIRSARSTSP